MIRRGFWLTVGAVTGIYGYRRVSALGRRVSGTLSLASPASPAALTGTPARLAPGLTVRRARRGTIALARETYRFTRDVREGMDLYTARHSAPSGPTLSTDLSTDLSAHHIDDAQPEDGH